MVSSRQFKRAYRFRFYPTPEQENLLRRTVGCCRLVYNKALHERSTAWTKERRRVSYKDTSALLTEWKKTDDLNFLNEVSCVPLQQTLRHLQKAYSNFFNQTGDYPTYKRKSHGGSAEYTRSAFKWDGHNLTLAKMSEPLDIRWSRTLPRKAQPSTITVSLDPAGRWHVSILVEDTIARLRKKSAAVGIDLGTDSFAILSTGEKIDNPRHRNRDMKRRAKAQRALARKQKGSRNYEKALLKVARIQAHTKDRRTDFLHKLSTRLIRENQTIVLEDLAVRNMSRRCKPKPDPEHPGQYLPNRQAAKRGLNRSITDTGWREFRRMLEYKSEWYGRTLTILDRWYPSSQTCSTCGENTGRKPLDIRQWDCPYCGTHHDRDINAAKNILAAGLAVTVCGDGRSRRDDAGSDR